MKFFLIYMLESFLLKKKYDSEGIDAKKNRKISTNGRKLDLAAILKGIIKPQLKIN
jgi:hypothetical protein